MRDGFFFEYEFVCVYVVNKRITFHKVELVKLKYHNFLGLCLSLVAGLGPDRAIAVYRSAVPVLSVLLSRPQF